MFGFLFLLALGAAVLSAFGLAFVDTMWVGWAALFIAVVFGVVGLLFLTWLFDKLIRLSIGSALSPAEDRLGKLIALTFAAITVTTIPWFFWEVGTRLLANLFGGNPGYESLSNVARTNCGLKDQGCITRALENVFGTLWRFFRSLLADLNLTRFPLIDLFWFLAATIAAAFVVAIIRSHVKKQTDGRYSLEALRSMIPETVRARIPVSILLLVAFYLALSAMFALPVLRSARDIIVNPEDVAKRLTTTDKPIDRLVRLDVGLVKIDFDDPVRPAPEPASSTEAAPQAQQDATPRVTGAPSTPAPATTGRIADVSQTDRNQAARIQRDRIQNAKSHSGVYDRQREEFKRVIESASTRLSQLAAETTAQATSSPRAFLGQRDRDRYVTAIIDHYWASIARYEAGLFSCRKVLIEFREQIEQFKTASPDSSLRSRLWGINLFPGSLYFADLDRTAIETVRVCQAANNPERIAPKLPPDPFEILGPFGATVRWLTATDSRAIATIVGMIGFGLLGATLSRMIRKSEKEEGQLIGVETFFVVAGGVTAALVVFLGSYAVLGEQGSEANSHLIFVTCLVGAVFSEDIWVWARKKFTPKSEDESSKEEPRPDSKTGPKVKPETVTAIEPVATPASGSETTGEKTGPPISAASLMPRPEAPSTVASNASQRAGVVEGQEGEDWDRYKR